MVGICVACGGIVVLELGRLRLYEMRADVGAPPRIFSGVVSVVLLTTRS